MANYLALRLDRLGAAEMSCIAGLGGDVPQLVRKAQSGRPILAIDGCPLQCVRKTLVRHGLAPQKAVTLSELGVKKRQGRDFEVDEAEQILGRLVVELTSEATAMARVEQPTTSAR